MRQHKQPTKKSETPMIISDECYHRTILKMHVDLDDQFKKNNYEHIILKRLTSCVIKNIFKNDSNV